MRRCLQRSTLSLAVLSLACGGGGGTPSGPRPTAALAVTAQPASWRVVPCSGCAPLVGELETTGVVVVTESAGAAVTLSTLDVSALNAGGAATNTSQTRPLTARIASRGQTTLDIAYHFPGTAQAAAVRVTIGGNDEFGHMVSTTLTIPLIP